VFTGGIGIGIGFLGRESLLRYRGGWVPVVVKCRDIEMPDFKDIELDEMIKSISISNPQTTNHPGIYSIRI